MGLFGDLAGGVVKAAGQRVSEVQKYKDEYAYDSESGLLSRIKHASPTSPQFAAISLLLQENYGYSSEDVVAAKKGR